MAAPRPAVTLRLSCGLKEKVLRSGYDTVADLLSVPVQELAAELKLSPDQMRELALELRPSRTCWTTFTASQTLQQEMDWTAITTSNAALDRLFGSAQGVPPGKITEVCGLSGTGKTQLGIQLCINAQMPVSLGGASGTAIFVDTEGSFVARRAAQMAAACLDKVRAIDEQSPLTAESLLNGIKYCRVHSPVELIAIVRMLDTLINDNPLTKLVVLDTIAMLVRSNFDDMSMRTKLIANLGRQLADLARRHEIAIVVMNQMTIKADTIQSQSMQDGDRSFVSQFQPALGETWANLCTHRIRLYAHEDGQRSARLFKSPALQEQSALFQIDSCGMSNAEGTVSQMLGSPPEGDTGVGFEPEEALVLWEESLDEIDTLLP